MAFLVQPSKAQVSLCRGMASVVRPLTFPFKWLIFKNSSIYSKLSTNVPYRVPTKS